MTTHICPITETSLEEAKQMLLRGGTVAFPTETVYGLGADARSDEAVRSIYAIKGRPSDNPLIVHVHKDYALNSLVFDDMPYAKKLRDAFLPGPLTLVYRSKGAVSKIVSCGLDTLAVRVPKHEGAQRFLRYVDLPVAAPSANRSKHISPVTAQHVYGDLAGSVPLILDGGACSGGIESTVCDVTGPYPVILREGLVTREQIERVAGRCDVYHSREGEQVRSPGMKYKHYAPHCRTVLFAPDELEHAVSYFSDREKNGERVLALCEHAVLQNFPKGKALDLGKNGEEFAANLYVLLHEAEERCDELIAVEPAERGGVMAGVLNRLRKACGAKQ